MEKKKKGKLPLIFFANRFSANLLFNILIIYLVNFTLFFGLQSFYKFMIFGDINYYLAFIFIFSSLEYVARDYMFKRYLKIVVQSMGIIIGLISILILALLDSLLYEFIHFESINSLVLFSFIFLVVRFLFFNYYMRKKFGRM